MKQFRALWGPVLGWMALIFFLSAQPSLPRLAPAPLEELITRLAHVLEYAVLGMLLFRAAAPPGRLPGRALSLALWVFMVVYGITDELHQSFVPGRNASAEDLAADALGAFIGALVFYYRRAQGSTKEEGAPGALPP